jgi:hypothetical protein
MTPRVMILILNWNGLDDTLASLASLAELDYPDCEVVVVDNGSTDGSVTAIQKRFPEITVIENEENLGFAGGNNVGLRYAMEQGVDYALLLNNDTEVAPDFLRRLVDVAEADPAFGIAGPTIYYYDQPDVVWSAGGAIDWRRGETRMIGLNERDTDQFGPGPRPVDFVTGCALLAKRAVIEQAGLLDERFFAYYEEAEWCVRVRQAGFKIIHVPQARVWHKIPLDARDSSPVVHYYMVRNQLLFLRATGAPWQAWLRVLVGHLRTLVSWSVRRRWQHKRFHRSTTLRALLDAGLGRWGRRRLHRERINEDSGAF